MGLETRFGELEDKIEEQSKRSPLAQFLERNLGTSATVGLLSALGLGGFGGDFIGGGQDARETQFNFEANAVTIEKAYQSAFDAYQLNIEGLHGRIDSLNDKYSEQRSLLLDTNNELKECYRSARDTPVSESGIEIPESALEMGSGF